MHNLERSRLLWREEVTCIEREETEFSRVDIVVFWAEEAIVNVSLERRRKISSLEVKVDMAWDWWVWDKDRE